MADETRTEDRMADQPPPISGPSDEVLEALEDVVKVLADEDRPEEDFYVAADRFLQTFHAELADRDLVDGSLEEWDPRPALLAFEGQLAADRSIDVDVVAACKTVRDSLDATGREMAALN
jgi:hypothetical protein